MLSCDRLDSNSDWFLMNYDIFFLDLMRWQSWSSLYQAPTLVKKLVLLYARGKMFLLPDVLLPGYFQPTPERQLRALKTLLPQMGWKMYCIEKVLSYTVFNRRSECRSSWKNNRTEWGCDLLQLCCDRSGQVCRDWPLLKSAAGQLCQDSEHCSNKKLKADNILCLIVAKISFSSHY